MRILRFLSALSLGVLLLFSAAALAENRYPKIELSVCAQDAAGQETGERVRLWEYGNNTTFFLPAYADTAQLTLYFSSAYASVKIDDAPCASGQPLALDLTAAHTIRYGAKTYKLRFMQSENLPTMYITTESGNLEYIHAKNGNRETGTVCILSGQGEVLLDSAFEYIRGRGNSSFYQPKKPYQIKFEEKTSLFDMPKAKKWILLANHKDNSFLRNDITLEASRILGDPYTTSAAYADVYINGCYAGNYQVCEKVEIAQNRIDVVDLEKATQALNDLPLDQYKRFGSSRANKATQKGYEIPNNPEDITGGYLLELEKPFHYPEATSGFVTKRGQCVVIKSPEFASKEQVAYISSYMQSFENAIFAQDGVDPDTGKYYTDFVDLDSMVREYLLEEVFKNYDVNRSSQFIVKPSDSEDRTAHFGPVWDFDLSMGDWCSSKADQAIASPKKLVAAKQTSASYWLPALYQHRDFYERAITLYFESFEPYLRALLSMEPSESVVPLAQRGEEMLPSARMNFTRWPTLNNSQWYVKTGATYEENIAFLQSWLQKRMEYLESEWKSDYQALKNGADVSK